MFKPSQYQQAIFDYLAAPTHATAVVMAGPGAGKTTTIVRGLVAGRVAARVVAFNKNAAETLTGKLEAAGNRSEARTFHSAGLRLLRSVCPRARVQGSKYYWIVSDLLTPKKKPPHPLAREVSNSEITNVVEWCMTTCAVDVEISRGAKLSAKVPVRAPHNFEWICERFQVDADPAKVWAVVRQVIRQGVAEAHRRVGFIDMIWLPVALGLRAPAMDVLIVDEAQDMSEVTYRLSQLLAGGAPVVYVGDPNQAIFGFAGARGGMLQDIVDAGAAVMRLPVCYRCPSTHVALANSLTGLPAPGAIEARPGAPAGVRADISDTKFREDVADGDLVLCRYTAPLVRSCVAFLAAGKAAQVRGRTIGKGLAELARKIERATGSIAKGTQWLADRETEDDKAHTDLADRVAAIDAIRGWSGAKTAKQFADAVKSMFADDVRGIEHSTVHRAKGNEAHTVWVLQPEDLTTSSEGEACVTYVAYTRAQHALYFVR